MSFQEIIKKKFAAAPKKNFVMVLMRLDGKDYTQFYNIKDPGDGREWSSVLDAITRQTYNTALKKDGSQ